MQFSEDDSDCMWTIVLLKFKENMTGLGKVIKWSAEKAETTERSEKKLEICLSQFVRPIHRHASSLFLLEAHLY